MLSALTKRWLTAGIGNQAAADEIDGLLGSLGNNTFFVSSVAGSDTGGFDGRSWQQPLATIAAALLKCGANRGDVIYVMPGHNENIGNAQLTWNVAGVTIVGLGDGAARPRFDFDHANASIDITASSVRVKNIVLFPSVTDVLIGIDINTLATDVKLEDVESIPGEDGAGVDDFALGIDVKVGCSRTKIIRYRQRQHASGAGYLAGIRLTGASDDILIEDPDIVIVGAGAIAGINGITTLSTNVDIIRGRLTSDNEPGIEMLTGTTGRIIDTKIFSDLATIAAATVADGMAHFGVKYVEVGNESDAVVKTASVDD